MTTIRFPGVKPLRTKITHVFGTQVISEIVNTPADVRNPPKTLPHIHASSVQADVLFAACVDQETCGHGFFDTIISAFNAHRPVILTPGAIFLLVQQALSAHVNASAGALRGRFVPHATGRQEIVIDRDDFVLGNPNNDWAGFIQQVVDRMKGLTLPQTVDALVATFSTQTDVEQVAGLSTVMAICQKYFKYVCRTRCGFPFISLDGTSEDWQTVLDKSRHLLKHYCVADFGVQWGHALLPVLEKFVAAVQGERDLAFWNSFIKQGGRRGSGAYTVFSGWFNVFLPMLDGNVNRFCEPYDPARILKHQQDKEGIQGPDVAHLPSGQCTVPVLWKYRGLDIPLTLRSGFLGFTETAEGAFRPEVGWVLHDGEQVENSPDDIPDPTA